MAATETRVIYVTQAQLGPGDAWRDVCDSHTTMLDAILCHDRARHWSKIVLPKIHKLVPDQLASIPASRLVKRTQTDEVLELHDEETGSADGKK